jgi:hypothetical protein
MKKLILVLAVMLLVFGGKAWALPDNLSPVELSGSQVIKATSGVVYMVSVNYIGVTVGDSVQILDGGSGGTARMRCVASSVSGNCTIPLTVGAYMATGIYYKENKTSGNFYTDVQYF